MLRTLVFVSLLLSSTVAHAQAILADVSSRVGRASTFIYRFTPEQYPTRLTQRDVIWSNQPTTIQGGADRLTFPPGVFSGAYVTVNRVPANPTMFGKTRLLTACNDERRGGCTLTWFQRNHPEWIIYRSDQVTPAYQFDDKTWIPLDISNLDVQAWIKANFFLPILRTGYQALSVDNVTARNQFDEAGVCTIVPKNNCTLDGGVWKRLYSGQIEGDRDFIRNRVEWVRTITKWAHGLGKRTMGNVTYVSQMPTSSADLINAFDVWFDEGGFTGASDPSLCYPARVGSSWINKVNFITGLNDGSGPKAYVSENSICPVGGVPRPRMGKLDLVEYTIASYLIVKNKHTYISMFFGDGDRCGIAAFCEDVYPSATWPHLYLEHGSPEARFAVRDGIYFRPFKNSVALVNPSTDSAHTFDLGVASFYRYDCNRYTGRVTLLPVSGMVLLKDKPLQCAGRE